MNFKDILNFLASSGFHPLFGAEVISAVLLSIWVSLFRRNSMTLPSFTLSVLYINYLTATSIALGVYSSSQNVSWAIISLLLWSPVWRIIIVIEPYIFKCGLLVGLAIYPAWEYYISGGFTFYSWWIDGLMICSIFINPLLHVKHPVIPVFLQLAVMSEYYLCFEGIVIASNANILLRLSAFGSWLLLRSYLGKVSFYPFHLLLIIIFPAIAWLLDSNGFYFYVQIIVSLELIIIFLGGDWAQRISDDNK